MIHVDQEYSQEVECEYKGEKYKVRDNGAIMRMAREGKNKRPKDEIWTFGEKIDRGYAKFCGESVHRIVAVAFLGNPPTNQHVVDHIDTNRQNNRPENLRWLTKLENILLNPITRSKIEYLCGSVESFLADPSQLNGHENDDNNFAWMRAVSKEESQNTMASWEKLLCNPRPESKKSVNAIGEWIYEHGVGGNKEKDILADIDFDKIIASSNESAQDVVNPNVDDLSSDAEPEIDFSVKMTKEVPITKMEFMNAFLEICKKGGWEYKKYYKDDGWSTDILIIKDNQQFAFSVYNSVNKASKSLPLIQKSGVKVFGLILSPKRDEKSEIACFSLRRNDQVFEVNVAGDKLSLDQFVRKAVEGKIVSSVNVRIVAVDVIFEQVNCYFCKAPHYVFVPSYLIDDNGIRRDLTGINCDGIPDLQFGDEILKDVKQYIAEHPEKGYEMGEVKERYSKTIRENYMSFGCPKCDGILGEWYLEKMQFDLMYETDENLMDRIILTCPFEINVKGWVVLG